MGRFDLYPWPTCRHQLHQYFSPVSGGAYGFHQWDITVRELSKEQLLLSLVIWAVYGPCLWFIKVCLFVLYLEIFGLLRWLRHLAIFGIVTTGLFYFASMVAFLVLCSPQSGHSQIAYLTALASPKCSKSMPLATVIGAVSVASDLYLVVLPLPAVWSLQLPFHRKIGVSAMFLTGFIACIASMLGLYYRVVEVGNVDNTWAVIPTWITTIVEITAGIIVCCMPSAAAVFVELRGPVSSFLAKSRKGFRSFTRSISTSHHENLGSTANLRPPFGDSNPQDNGQAQYEMQKLWSGPEGGWGECQAEPETMAVFPLEDTRIRKSTKVEVTRGSGKY